MNALVVQLLDEIAAINLVEYPGHTCPQIDKTQGIIQSLSDLNYPDDDLKTEVNWIIRDSLDYLEDLRDSNARLRDTILLYEQILENLISLSREIWTLEATEEVSVETTD